MKITDIGEIDQVEQPFTGFCVKGTEDEVKVAARTMWGEELEVRAGSLTVASDWLPRLPVAQLIGLDFVYWDRYATHELPAPNAVIYGWIPRKDGQRDFVLLTCVEAGVGYVTSSAKWTEEIGRRLAAVADAEDVGDPLPVGGGHGECVRVETHPEAEGIGNVIRGAAHSGGGPLETHRRDPEVGALPSGTLKLESVRITYGLHRKARSIDLLVGAKLPVLTPEGIGLVEIVQIDSDRVAPYGVTPVVGSGLGWVDSSGFHHHWPEGLS